MLKAWFCLAAKVYHARVTLASIAEVDYSFFAPIFLDSPLEQETDTCNPVELRNGAQYPAHKRSFLPAVLVRACGQ